MPGFFSAADVEKLAQEREQVAQKLMSLRDLFLAHKFETPRGAEYAYQGFCRRVDELDRTINFVFSSLPPEQEDIPDRDERIAATILVQSFVINVQGCIDNLAWIWVHEIGLKGPDGKEIKRGWVGLGEKNSYVLGTLSKSFRQHMRGRSEWLTNLSEFRDAHAHRIPPYVPPFIISEDKKSEYKRLDDEAIAAFQKEGKTKYDELRAEQQKLGTYRPWVIHSPTEKLPWSVFHKQLLQDALTIDEIARKVLEELAAYKKPDKKPDTPKPLRTYLLLAGLAAVAIVGVLFFMPSK